MEVVINKYQNGKIYTIRSPNTDKYYIGSTIEKYLSSRLNGHNAVYKSYLNGKGNNIMSFEILSLGDAYIELLEIFPCNSKLELYKREGELIREHKLNCVNRKIEGRTPKEYNQDNKVHISKRSKQYHENNKTEILERQHEYNITNKTQISDRKKLYYANNRDKILKYKKQLSEKVSANVEESLQHITDPK